MKTLCIGVAGGTGSGKTTVANEIVRRVGRDRIVIVNQDRYYQDLAHLDDHRRSHHNFDHPNAIEEALLEKHIALLKAGEAAPLPVYDFARHVRLAATEWVDPQPVILVEGILILADQALRELMDIKVFVDADSDVRVIRRLERDVSQRGRTLESVVRQYLKSVRPMHLEFVEPSKRYADIIIPKGGYNDVAVDMLITKIESIVRDERRE